MNDNILKELWESSISFKQFWKSYFYMILHPKDCLRLMNFGLKVAILNGFKL